MPLRSLVVAVVVVILLAGCGGPATTPDDGAPTTTAPAPTTSPASTTPTPTPTTAPPPTTDSPTTTTAPDAYFPVPDGAVATYAPVQSHPVSNSTRVQVFDAPLTPQNATDWYRSELTDWTLRIDVPSYTGEWGWMNRLVLTRGEDLLFVYVTDPRPDATTGMQSEISLARGTENVGMGDSIYFGHLGWDPVTFTTPPVAPERLSGIQPLGNLAPPSHTFPTDHAYLFVPEDERPADTVAPADGIVTAVWLGSSDGQTIDDYAITIAHSNVHVTQFQHMSSLDPALVDAVGPLEQGENEVYLEVDAGTRLGTAAMPESTALDWFVYDYTRPLDGFAHPEFYGPGAFTHHFLDYASPDVRAVYEPKLTRATDPRYGKIDYDTPGALAGNWFLETDPVQHGDREGQLAFVYSVYDPDVLRVSVGGTVVESGRYRVVGNGPDPASVTADTGPVTYYLEYVHGSGQVEPGVVGTIHVAVLDENRIRVQGWNRDVDDPAFTEDARIYVR